MSRYPCPNCPLKVTGSGLGKGSRERQCLRQLLARRVNSMADGASTRANRHHSPGCGGTRRQVRKRRLPSNSRLGVRGGASAAVNRCLCGDCVLTASNRVGARLMRRLRILELRSLCAELHARLLLSALRLHNPVPAATSLSRSYRRRLAQPTVYINTCKGTYAVYPAVASCSRRVL